MALYSSIINLDKEALEEYFKKYFIHYDLIDDVFKYNITYTPKFTDFSLQDKALHACPLALNEIYIDADCRLGLCCKDYFKEFDYGCLLKDDFRVLYLGEKMSEIRKMHENMTLPEDHFCRKCLLFEAANGF